jgi:hypothetical protein
MKPDRLSVKGIGDPSGYRVPSVPAAPLIVNGRAGILFSACSKKPRRPAGRRGSMRDLKRPHVQSATAESRRLATSSATWASSKR